MSAGSAPSPHLHRTVREGPGPTIVLVHGFTQTSASWAPVAPELDAALGALGVDPPTLVAVDAPGHGASGALSVDLAEGARLLADDVAHLRADAFAVGYSMGARLLLRLLIDRPALLAGAVLLGATAGIDDEDDRLARRASDEALARDLERDGVAAFVDRWLHHPLFAGLPASDADRAARLANTVDGLSSSLRLAGTGTMDPPWWDEVAQATTPTLVTWGASDGKFAHLGRRLAASLPQAEAAAVADAGHAAHLEQPAAFAALAAGFVAERIRRGSTAPR